MAAGRAAAPQAGSAHCNQVRLVGRVAAPANERVLPSGDQIATWRLIVDRADVDRATARREVDTVTCAAFAARVRRQSLTWNKGDVVEVAGALRSRFWRGGAGIQSRVEVEVRSAARQASGLKRPRRPA